MKKIGTFHGAEKVGKGMPPKSGVSGPTPQGGKNVVHAPHGRKEGLVQSGVKIVSGMKKMGKKDCC
jgi:hypothetical protein